MSSPPADESTLTSCDVEPITRLERVQSFGFLLALSSDWMIMRASANLEAFLGVSARHAIGRRLDSLVDAEALHDMRNRLTGLQSTGGTERLYGIDLIGGGPRLDLAVHYADGLCILEGEPAGLDSRMDAASLVRKMLARLGKQASMEGFHADAARQIRTMTGFDRVMIYQFSEGGAGEVIAESTGSGMESFLGLHYPASDIPVQARALYVRNAFRIIADVGATTTPLLSTEPAKNSPLDLSLAMTRAVSPVHIQYLRNMGVAASLSISIIVDGILWGLIACHHGRPRLPTFIVRTAAELFGQMYSMTLESRMRRAQDLEDDRQRRAIATLSASIDADNTLLMQPAWLHDALRPLIQCDGVAVAFGGRLTSSGATLAVADIDAITTTARALPEGAIFATDSVTSRTPVSDAPGERAAGAMCIPLSHVPTENVLLLRREQLLAIRWAGDPSKVPSSDDGAVQLSPRKSFAAFTESSSGRSSAFTAADHRVAESLRTVFINAIHRGAYSSDGDRQRATERQELLIAELNHRVRNVLALIRGLISQTTGEAGDAASYVKSLSGRVQALARAHDRVTRQNWGPGPFNAIFDDEISAYVPTRRDRFVILGDTVYLHPQAFSTCALIVHELVTNSSKYGALSDNGRVEVHVVHQVGEGLHLHWRELDGPAVRTPTRRGFGSVIIERVVPFDLQGSASIQYLPAGLQADFFIPERHIAPAPGHQEHPAPVSAAHPSSQEVLRAHARPLEGLKVLLLEDNLIVALEAEDLLRALGASEICTASTLAAADTLLAAENPRFAVLDINLGFETSVTFGDRLRDAGVPFIFTTGYSETMTRGAQEQSALTVSKPYDREQLGRAIADTLDRLPRR